MHKAEQPVISIDPSSDSVSWETWSEKWGSWDSWFHPTLEAPAQTEQLTHRSGLRKLLSLPLTMIDDQRAKRAFRWLRNH